MPNVECNKEIRLQAPAKVNLYLKVLDKRPDGDHNLVSLFQMVGLYDQLALHEAPEGIHLQIENSPMPADSSNLVYRAAALLQEEMAAKGGPQKGVEITLTKKIPLSSGLGGGSSDAAATLIGLNRLWSLNWPRERLSDLGARLGSDVPFFFYGPTAWVSGRGERVEALAAFYSGWIVLLHPGIPVSTASVYAEYDKKIGLTKARRPPRISPSDRRRTALEGLIDRPYNDLEKITLNAHPQLKKLKTRLRALGGEGVMMSGSGPTLFGLFKDPLKANAVAAAIERAEKIKVSVAPILTESPF